MRGERVIGVKHPNPRQGITTDVTRTTRSVSSQRSSVKHLNPRQGITTADLNAKKRSTASFTCETPKSPPGDYNRWGSSWRICRWRSPCETPKSPPGDYNGAGVAALADQLRSRCETPKSPPGDYNCASAVQRLPLRNARSVKHLNPRQGITTSGSTGFGEPRSYV